MKLFIVSIVLCVISASKGLDIKVFEDLGVVLRSEPPVYIAEAMWRHTIFVKFTCSSDESQGLTTHINEFRQSVNDVCGKIYSHAISITSNDKNIQSSLDASYNKCHNLAAGTQKLLHTVATMIEPLEQILSQEHYIACPDPIADRAHKKLQIPAEEWFESLWTNRAGKTTTKGTTSRPLQVVNDAKITGNVDFDYPHLTKALTSVSVVSLPESSTVLKFTSVGLGGTILSPMVNAISWITGVGTREAQMENKEAIQDLHKMLIKNTNHMVKFQDNMVSITQQLEKATQRAFKRVDQNAKVLAQAIHQLKDNMEVMINNSKNQLSDIQMQVDFLGFATLLTNLEFVYRDYEGLVSEQLDTLTALINTIRQRQTDPSIISAEDVLRILKEISTSIAPGYKIIPELSDPSNYYALESSIISMPGGFGVGSLIPLVAVNSARYVYVMDSLPLWVGNQWVKVVSSGDRIMIRENDRMWAAISEPVYYHCRSNPMSVCTYPIAWSSDIDDSCEYAIVMDPQHVRTSCSLIQIQVPPARFEFAMIIQDNDWLYSTKSNDTLATSICYKYDTATTDQSTLKLSPLSRVTVNGNCTIRTATLELGTNKAPWQSVASSLRSTHVLDSKATTTVRSLTSLIVGKPLPHMITLSPMMDSQIVFDNGMANVAELYDAIQDDKKVYIDKIQMLSEKVSKTLTTGYDSNLSWEQWLMIITTILVGLIYLVVIIRLIRAHVLGKSGALISMIPMKSWGAEASGISNTTGMAQIQLTVADPIPIISSYTEFIIMCCVALGMMLFTIYYMWSLRRWLKHRLGAVSAQLGYIPQNRKITHHTGETKLVVYFLMEAYNIWGARISMQEVCGQIMTLPGNAMGWKVTIDGFPNMVKCIRSVRRWNTWMVVGLVWDLCSLHSSEFPTCDVTNDMPSEMILKVSDIMSSCYANIPWYWWTIRPTQVTRLCLQGPGYSYPLYEYSHAARPSNMYAQSYRAQPV